MDLREAIEKIEQGLRNELPGKSAHLQMAPLNRSLQIPEGLELRESAVLLFLYEKHQQAHIVFMRRPEYNGPHSGQISFPGGKIENVDKDLQDTAMRETNEELGIPVQDISIIGALSTLVIPHSKFMVYPFIGYSKKEVNFIPDQVEVEEVIEIPIGFLLNEEIRGEHNFKSKTGEVLAPYFNLNGQRLWGATSMILSEFLTILDT